MNTQEIIAELQRALDNPTAAGRIIRNLIKSLSDSCATVAVYNDSPCQDITPVFDVVMTSVGQNKIPVIRTIREILGCGIKESKEMTDADVIGIFHSKIIKSKVNLDAALLIKRKLEDDGASVNVTRCK
jgi:ribosomal protein L7/L12